MQIARTVIETVAANGTEVPQSSARPKATAPITTPTMKPVLSSLDNTRQASRRPISRSARLRMIVVTVWEPALPPVPMRSGMKKERATTAASSLSK